MFFSSQLSLLALVLFSEAYAFPAPPDNLNTTASLNDTSNDYNDFYDLVTNEIDRIKRTTIQRPALRWIQCINSSPSKYTASTFTTLKLDIIDTSNNEISTYQNAANRPTHWAEPYRSSEQSLMGFKGWDWDSNYSDLFAEMHDLVHNKLYGPWEWFMMLCPFWTMDHWAAGYVWFIFVGTDGQSWAIRRGGGNVYSVVTPDIMYPIDAARELLRDLPKKPGLGEGALNGSSDARQLQEVQ